MSDNTIDEKMTNGVMAIVIFSLIVLAAAIALHAVTPIDQFKSGCNAAWNTPVFKE